ncbi:hypothetical protein ADN00_16205 [Ornatilinea apprima]|uniref:Uncharacterized protein n=1 Tax=Ornatilinea apprima TaxID=1134406 RepID=A0A0P6XKJ0_9CHLR|nr:nucleoside-triphosphatase [Ornatilinea apprima]KPL72029.1 hypothetical protein ADN00_16205 [Ornatilinea apprima]
MNEAGTVLIITGWRGAGKTSLCQMVVEQARQRGWDVAGVISLPVLEKSVKTGIEIIAIRSNERRLLARSTALANTTLQTHAWAFDPVNMQWGNEILKSAVPCDLLMVDELGPLEFERQQGWLEGLRALDSGQFKLALVVIRPELVAQARSRWPQAVELQINTVTEAPALAQQIIDQWLRSPANRS